MKRENISRLARLSAIVAAICLCSTAMAGPLTISFTTSGAFSDDAAGELAFIPGAFSGTVTPNGTLQVSNLGQIVLALPSDLEALHGQTFTLSFRFAPELCVTDTVEFTGTLHGAVGDHDSGKVQVHFNPDESRIVTFNNPAAAGTFTLSLDNVKGLGAGGSATLTGALSLTSVAIPTDTLRAADVAPLANPEPAPVVLAGSALIAISLLTRRKFPRKG